MFLYLVGFLVIVKITIGNKELDCPKMKILSSFHQFLVLTDVHSIFIFSYYRSQWLPVNY